MTENEAIEIIKEIERQSEEILNNSTMFYCEKNIVAGCETMKRHIEAYKLAEKSMNEIQEYRATGLNPSMIVDLKKSEKKAHKDAMENAQKLDEYRDMEERGLLQKLPCRVGDALYYTHPEHLDGDIEKYIVTGFCFDRQGCQIRTYNPKGVIIYFYPGFIGKTVFLTPEEAEKALQERKEDSE